MPQQQVAVSDAPDVPAEPFAADRFAFLFDVDGTLIDIAATPQAVHVPPDLLRNLDRLNTLSGGATALVSGRPIADLTHLFAPLAIALIGGHGAEFRVRSGNVMVVRQSTPPLDETIRKRIAEFKAIDPRLIIEDKGYSIAVHYRLAPDKEQLVLDAIAALDAQIVARQIEVLRGKAVVELKRKGLNKGTGVRALMAQPPFQGRRPVYVGDDVTDEDAFAVMPEFDGVPISVGRTVKGIAHRFDDPAQVREWIADLCRINDGPSGGPSDAA
jgi:trehalose 6-phosphate phosphatase